MNKIIIIFCIYYLFTSNLLAQITVEQYESEMQSFSVKKLDLQNEITDLKNEIEEMSNTIPELEQEVITAYRELYVLQYGEDFGHRVAYNQVWKGMSEEMMHDSWGEPDKIDSNVQSYGVFNQFYYGDVTFFFRDGKLIDWEESEEGGDEESIFYLNKRK
jgi:hypothetical protein